MGAKATRDLLLPEGKFYACRSRLTLLQAQYSHRSRSQQWAILSLTPWNLNLER